MKLENGTFGWRIKSLEGYWITSDKPFDTHWAAIDDFHNFIENNQPKFISVVYVAGLSKTGETAYRFNFNGKNWSKCEYFPTIWHMIKRLFGYAKKEWI